MNVRKLMSVVVMFLAVTLVTPLGMAAEYTMTASRDYTRLYAMVMPFSDNVTEALIAWWNENKAKKLGVSLKVKKYDMRYDASVVASTWPSILTVDKPICHFGLGGCDAAALMKRLPKDKVPLFNSTGTYGFIWKPNQWIFHPRPTYPHEIAGFLNWARMNKIKDRPIRVGILNSKAVAAFVDMVAGFKAFAKVTPWVEVVGTEWAEAKPVTLLSEVRRLSRQKPDYIWIATTADQVIGTIKAQKELGVQIPVVASSHNSLSLANWAIKDINFFEGHYDVYAGDPGLDLNVPGAKLVTDYWKKNNIDTKWNLICVQVFLPQMLTFMAVERAVAMVGKDNITGEAIYNAMFGTTFTEEGFMGLASSMTFTKDCPFSTKDLKVKATTVRNGKHISVTGKEWIPVPEVPKWVTE